MYNNVWLFLEWSILGGAYNSYQYKKCHDKQWWASSRVFRGHYLINQEEYRYMYMVALHYFCVCIGVHVFTCDGIFPIQYNHFSEFSGMGIVGK